MSLHSLDIRLEAGAHLYLLRLFSFLGRRLNGFRVQWSAVTVTPSGIGKSVTVTDCHSNSSFL